MRPVYQDDFSAGGGNALQAAVASILELELDSVPNFIKAPGGYQTALGNFLRPRGLCFLKVNCRDNGKLEFPPAPGANCILTGKSPRGEFKHCVVGKTTIDNDGFEIVHDPHPDESGIVGPVIWAGFFVMLDPASSFSSV